ncbi:MAG TPA: hypothetical protein DCY88_04470 [Cyanobacteria bacterium UBA11372]|nr:hypothetical protein [Cyanobacteria bacterium UBA11372]
MLVSPPKTSSKVAMLRNLISKGLNQAQIDIKQQIAMLLDDFKSKQLNLPTMTAMGTLGDRLAASRPRTSSQSKLCGVAFALPAIFSSRIQATLVPYQPKGLTRLQRSC